MNKPTHEEVTERARQIWQNYGSPAGRDVEIWLEAEKQLAAGPSNPPWSGDAQAQTSQRNEVQPAPASAPPAEQATSINSPGNISAPVIPDNEAVKADLQKKAARAPKLPGKKAPKSPPAETGKPLWSKPHSS